jgi:succinate dehydrogenase / fumarate reductase flavoprotein subunit
MRAETHEVHEHDLIVIGAGGAGLRAAIAASMRGGSVGLVCKSLLGKAHTVMAEGGIAAALANVDPADGWQVHFADTMRGGQFINDYRMAELHARESPERVYELEEWGALFDRTPEGQIMQRPFGAHTYRRLCHVGDRTGLEMIRTLQDKAVHSGVEVYMETTLTRLLIDGNRIAGAFGYVRESGRFVLFKAKAVVLATGGWGKVYQVTSNSWESTGDGVVMAYEAGAELVDMEMVQFHPTGMVWPPGVRGILVTEGVRGEGGILKNNKGERFMERYDPKKMELSSRDVVARAIYTEVQEGRGSEHGGAYLDITHRGEAYIKKKLPSMYEQFLKLADIDIAKQSMEVAPTIHYAMGGVRVEPETGASTVLGLFACGEVAGGVHGANRLGGNSLSDLLVFGKRAGEGAAQYVKSLSSAPKIDEAQIEAEKRILLRPFEGTGQENPYQLHEELQSAMQEGAGIARTAKSLEKTLKRILELQERAKQIRVSGSRLYNPGWHTARDLLFMLTVSEAIVRGAMERKESRGAHWRQDFPNKDEQWSRRNLITYKDASGAMKIKTMPVPEMPAELKKLFEPEDAAVAKK